VGLPDIGSPFIELVRSSGWSPIGTFHPTPPNEIILVLEPQKEGRE